MARKGIRRGAQGLIGDVLRKVPLSGVGEIRLPMDVRKVLVQNIEKVRESAVDIFAKEISKVLAKIDVHNIVDDVLRNYSLRIEARIDLAPKDGGSRESSPRKGRK
ncbi:MAG TPA: hypothetical protein VIH99_13500 [Bdellovibrionota bacterium]|jgi:hypothetical protein